MRRSSFKSFFTCAAAVQLLGACSDDVSIKVVPPRGGPLTSAAPTNPFSGIGFERTSYQSLSLIQAFVDTEISGQESVSMFVDGVEFVADVLAPENSPFSSYQNTKQLLQPRDQKTLSELLEYGSRDVTVSLSIGDIERTATFSVERSDFDIFGVTFTAPASNMEDGFDAWINPVMGGDASPYSSYAPISYSQDDALITGFHTIVHY